MPSSLPRLGKAWYEDPGLMRQMPRRMRFCAAYFRLVRVVQPRGATRRGHFIGGGFLVRATAALATRLGLDNRMVLDIEGSRVACDLSEPRTLTIIEEARGHHWQERFFRSVLATGDTYLDVGANGGGLTAVACRIVGRDGAVFAVEPQPHLAALVGRTIDLNDVGGRVFQTAAGDENGTATLVVPAGRSGSAALNVTGPGARVRVPVTRLDDLLGTMGDRRVRLMKIDVEGHELGAINGAVELISGSRPTIVLELNPEALSAAGESAAALLARLDSLGYLFAEVDDPHGARVTAAEVPLGRSRDLVAHPV